MPAKNWGEIQSIFVQLGPEGDLKARVLTPHEIDAVTPALTECLHLQGKTELMGNEEEGHAVVPTKSDWRLKL